MTGAIAKKKTRKVLLQGLGGAVAGAAATFLFLESFEGIIDARDAGQLIAACTGICYVLIGLLVAFGTAVPRLGAYVLNVEDADELVELRRSLVPSAWACVALGVFLISLALAGPAGAAGALPRDVAGLIAAGALGAIVLLAIVLSRRMDELSRQLSLESSSLCLQAAMLLFGGWAALAHLGYLSWFGPLGFLGGLALLQLVAVFVVVARRGLMQPR